MSYVRMRHPNLPEEQTITVAASAVPHHRAAGWVPVDTPEPEPEPVHEAAPADTASPEPQPARKRRRATEGE